MSSHKKRMSDIGRALGTDPRRVTTPGKGLALPEEYARISNFPMNELTHDALKTVIARLQATDENGAGLTADKELRHFYRESNNRLLEHGPDALNVSFNVMEAFMSWNSKFWMFDLREERDHQFSFGDFLDFATSPDAPIDAFQAAYELEEGIIYSFSSIDDPHDYVFSTAAGPDYGVGSFSMVRHGGEVSLLTVAGQRVQDVSDRDSADRKKIFNKKPEVGPHPSLQPGAVGLLGHRDLWKTLALVRLDLTRRSEEVRYVLHDDGNSFLITTDDPAVLSDLRNDMDEECISSLTARLNEQAVLFELCRTALLLPAYFKFKITLIRTKEVPTRFRAATASSWKRREQARARVPARARILFRRVSALEIVGPATTRPAVHFTPPKYQVQVDGFWRRIAPGREGKGPNGEPVIGRTWVAGHLRWRDRPAQPKEVLVKSRVSVARATVAAEKLAESIATSEPPSEELRSKPRDDEPASTTVSRAEAYSERRKLTPRVRWAVLERDRFRCTRCGADAAADSLVRLDVDHVLPVSRGGKTEPGNLTTLCSRCNNGKGSSIPRG